MRTVVLFILLFSTCTVLAQTEKPGNPKTVIQKFDPNRNPADDLKTAIKLAKKSNKRILLDVGGEWCIWCHRLDKFFEDNTDVNKFLKDNFVVVKVNYSPENKNEKFLSNYPKVAGYPHLFVLDKDGKFLHSQNTGELEEGKGHDHDKVLAFLQKWSPQKSVNSEQ